jgi:M6 family metalloprotease-like protein
MKPTLFLSLCLLLLLPFTYAIGQMPPHPDLMRKIRAHDVVLPSAMQNPELLTARGIDAPKRLESVSKMRGAPGLSRSYGPQRTPQGVWNALAILVTFSDKPSQTSAQVFDRLLFQNTSGTLRDYYQKVSYGALDIVTVNLPSSTGWKPAPQTYSYYVDANSGLGSYPRNAQKLAEDAVLAANSAVDFSRYDNDGDGVVDALFIIHAGQGAEFTGSHNDIWSHSWALHSPMYVDGATVMGYSMEPEYLTNPGDMTVGVFAHELGHDLFGLPDLYDRDDSSEGLGDWSLMASGSWNGNDGDSPAFPDAWSHIQMGYVTPTIVTGTRRGQSITAATTAPETFLLRPPGFPATEYFLVQNRSLQGYDVGLPGGGLLIFHVDEEVTTQNDLEWYPGHTSNGHYLVAMIQADNLWALEHKSRGDPGDCYPGITNNVVFDATSSPASMDYNMQSTLASVRSISAPRQSMTADLSIESGGTQPVWRDVPVDSGWNIVSVPVQAQDMTPGGLFPGAASVAFEYNQGYQIATTLLPGKGYWLRFNGQAVYSISGVVVTPPDLVIANGWNLVGPYDFVALATDILSDPPAILSPYFFGYHNGYTIAGALEVGKGYWINANQAGVAHLRAGAGGVGRVSSTGLATSTGRIQLEIQDQLARSGNLFIAEQGEGDDRYVLPPPPPPGIFDVRFGNDKLVARGMLLEHEIRVSGGRLPVVVTAHNLLCGSLIVHDGGVTGFSREIADGESIELPNGVTSFFVRPKEDVRPIPRQFSLDQNYPNPFNSMTKIVFRIPQSAHVRLQVLTLLGGHVATLADGEYLPGRYEAAFDAGQFASGLYFYRLEAGQFSAVKKLLLLR